MKRPIESKQRRSPISTLVVDWLTGRHEGRTQVSCEWKKDGMNETITSSCWFKREGKPTIGVAKMIFLKAQEGFNVGYYIYELARASLYRDRKADGKVEKKEEKGFGAGAGSGGGGGSGVVLM
ncbi:hypothetical protein M0804_001907 [Polistes exclamans]|nr:hypothetical protein M0804_001907 [Polistes exclamans]